MKRNILLLTIIIWIAGCQSDQPLPAAAAPPTLPATASFPVEEMPSWSIYDADPGHLWNRVFRQLYGRTASDGTEYGSDELDPLLWFDTEHLLIGASHRQTIEVFDEFLSERGEAQIREPLQRAMFQRDLWAVFDWLASQTEPYSTERRALETRLAQIIRRVALSEEEITSLPNNYALEVNAHTFPAASLSDDPEAAFLPADLIQHESAWLPVGREGGPVAMTHTEAFPFFGRSAFLVFVRSPDGREATLDFIESLNSEPNPVTKIGSEVALVRRMLLIDDQGEMILSPLVETIQLRHFSPAQSFHEFELSRSRLFEKRGGGLTPKTELFMLFMGHGDVFENSFPHLQAAIPQICKACHSEHPPSLNSGNTRSIVSYSRDPFALPENARPILFPTTPEAEARVVIEWKRNHGTWKTLEALWHHAGP